MKVVKYEIPSKWKHILSVISWQKIADIRSLMRVTQSVQDIENGKSTKLIIKRSEKDVKNMYANEVVYFKWCENEKSGNIEFFMQNDQEYKLRVYVTKLITIRMMEEMSQIKCFSEILRKWEEREYYWVISCKIVENTIWECKRLIW